MLRLLLILFVFSSAQPLFAWHTGDSSKVLALNAEAFELAYNQTALAKQKGFLALHIARAIGFTFGEAQANSRLGIVYDVEGKYDSALHYYKRSLAIHVKNGNKKGQGAALCNLGLLHLNRNRYSEALSSLHAAIKPLEEVNAYQFLGNCYNNIGMLYNELDNFKRAQDNFKLAISYYDRVNNVYQKANAISNLSMAFSDMGKTDSAIILLAQSIAIFEREEDFYNLAKDYNNLGILYESIGQSDASEKAYMQSVNNALKAEHWAGLADTYMNLATFYNLRNDRNKSNVFTRKAYKLAGQIESPKLKADIFYNYARICMREGDHKLAGTLLIRSKILKDSIFKSEISGKIANQEARFGLERKENENKQLKQKNRIQELEIRNKQNEIRSRQLTVMGVSGLSILSLAMTFIYLKRRYTIQKLKAENAHRKEQHKQRIDISHELHDNVGAQLSYIVSTLDILKGKLPEETRINALSDMSKQAIVTLRETVWALNNERITVTGFADKFKAYAMKMIENRSDVSLVFHEAIENDNTILPNTALHLFRICQEAFSNVLKHSGADQIEVLLSADAKAAFCFRMEDNGCGFDAEQDQKPGHYGLANMRSRAMEAGAKLQFTAPGNRGSICTLTLSKIPHMHD